MSENKRQKQPNFPATLFVHYCLSTDWENVIKGLLHLFLELNSNLRIMDFRKFYDSLKDNENFPSLSVLFLKIGGPFLTFEKFKAFFENLYLQGFLNFDMEEYDGKVEVCFLTLSKLKIEELVSQIKIVSSISLIQVFSHLSGMLTGGPITWLDLYNRDPSLKSFLDRNGKDKTVFKNAVEKIFQEYGVAVENHPHLSFTFPPNWGNTRSLLSFVLKLVSTIGFSEIPYSSDTLEEESPVKPVELFNRLTKLFGKLKKIHITLITDMNFLKPLCEISQTSQEQKKQIFALLVQFCFVIDNGIATPHPSFHIHVEHFVVAFMRISGASLEGVRVQGTIRTGPTWVHNDSKKRIVCSSVATGKCCRNYEKCKFLHPITKEHWIITTHCGKVFVVVCDENAMYDRTPQSKSILCCKFKNGVVSIDSTHPVACGDSAKPETLAVARGGSADPETHPVARGCSAKPEILAVARGCSAKPRAHAVACGDSAKPEQSALDGWLMRKISEHKKNPHSLNPPQLPHESDDDEEYDPNDPLIRHLFSRPPPDDGKHGSETDRIMRQFRTLSDPTDMAQLTALVVLGNRQNKKL